MYMQTSIQVLFLNFKLEANAASEMNLMKGSGKSIKDLLAAQNEHTETILDIGNQKMT